MSLQRLGELLSDEAIYVLIQKNVFAWPGCSVWMKGDLIHQIFFKYIEKKPEFIGIGMDGVNQAVAWIMLTARGQYKWLLGKDHKYKHRYQEIKNALHSSAVFTGDYVNSVLVRVLREPGNELLRAKYEDLYTWRELEEISGLSIQILRSRMYKIKSDIKKRYLKGDL